MVPANINPHRPLRILFIGDVFERYYSYHYYKFFKKMGHKVLSVCPKGNIRVVGLFDFQKTVLPQLRANGFQPDLIIAAESPPLYWANFQKIRKLVRVPLVLLSFDTALRHPAHALLGNNFDYVFISQQDYLNYFYRNCQAKTYWLQYGCDPEVHQPYNSLEINDIAFAGTAWSYPEVYQKRIDALDDLKKTFKVEIGEGYWDQQAAQLYGRSKLIFNLALQNGVNPRIYEALSYGKLLLTNRTGSLNGVFADHVHLVYYDSINHLRSLIRYYLKHPDKRLKIAAQGHYKAWLKHTFYHRIDLMLRKVMGNGIYKSLEKPIDT